jgi:hypothetical protein
MINNMKTQFLLPLALAVIAAPPELSAAPSEPESKTQSCRCSTKQMARWFTRYEFEAVLGSPLFIDWGKYTIRVSHGVRQKELVGIQATEQSKTEVLRVDLSAG